MAHANKTATEMTPRAHRQQRDLVLRSMLLADTPEDRHGDYPPRRRKAHTYTVPVVRELRIAREV